jgi:integrase
MQFRLVTLGNSPHLYVEWRENGSKRRVSARTSDRAAAEDFLAAFRLEYSTETPDIWPDVRAVLNWYYESHAKAKPSGPQAKIAIDKLSAFFGSTLVCDAKLQKQQAYADKRAAEGARVETIRRELSVLSAAFRRAQKFERIPGLAPPVLTLPEGAARERYLTRQEAAKLLRHLHANRRQRHLLLFTRLALYTGARSGAILSLTWERVDLDRGIISYPLPGRVETNKRAAVVPIGPSLIRGLKAAKRRSNSDHVIVWAGEPVARIVRAFRRQAKAAGLCDVTPHTLRHTFGTWAASSGVSLFLVGRALGHKRTSTTERYAKHQPDALREVTEAVRRGKRGASRSLPQAGQ